MASMRSYIDDSLRLPGSACEMRVSVGLSSKADTPKRIDCHKAGALSFYWRVLSRQ
jgi:hypothetical protein